MSQEENYAKRVSIIPPLPSFFLISIGKGKKKNKTDSLFSMLGFALTSNSQVSHCWLSFHPGSDFLSGFWVVIVIGRVLESEKSPSSQSREVAFGPSPDATCRPHSASLTFSDKLTVKTVRYLAILLRARVSETKSVAEITAFSLQSALFSEFYHFCPCPKAYGKNIQRTHEMPQCNTTG